jgi:dihydrofolate reductase
MQAIVAVTRDWGIGYQGDLLMHEREDMRHFVEHTRGATVVMGDRTLASFPGGRPLKGRHNIVLTMDDGLAVPEVEGTTSEVVRSLDELHECLVRRGGDDVWVIGGGSVYAQLLSLCTRVEVTKFDTTLPADTFFPNLDEDPAWRIVCDRDGGTTAEGVAFRFLTYTRVDGTKGASGPYGA